MQTMEASAPQHDLYEIFLTPEDFTQHLRWSESRHHVGPHISWAHVEAVADGREKPSPALLESMRLVEVEGGYGRPWSQDDVWDIEEGTPKWPDGKRMAPEDGDAIVSAVKEALGQCRPPGGFDPNEHYRLSEALIEAIVKAGAAEDANTADDGSYLSLAFLAGRMWQQQADANKRDHLHTMEDVCRIDS